MVLVFFTKIISNLYFVSATINIDTQTLQTFITTILSINPRFHMIKSFSEIRACSSVETWIFIQALGLSFILLSKHDLDSIVSCYLATSFVFALECQHCWFLEHWNRQKSLTNIWQCFSCLLDEWIANIWKTFSRWLFEIIHIIHFGMHMDRPDKSVLDLTLDN